MSQVNVNVPPNEPVEAADRGDRTAAAGINLITVLIVLAVLAIIAWYLFTGPLRALGNPGNSSTNVNVNPPATNIQVNPPSAPAPGGGESGGAGR